MRNSKTTRLCIRLIAVYLVCVIPICVWNVGIGERNLGAPCYQILGIFLYCLYWMQYAINNFIYAFSLPKYKQAARQLLAAILCRDTRTPKRLVYRRNRVLAVVRPIVSVISIEHCSEDQLHSNCSHAKCSSVNVIDEHSSASNKSTSVIISLHFPPTRGCTSETQITTDYVIEEDNPHQEYLITQSQRVQKASICASEWSFTGPRTAPYSVNTSILGPMQRKRSCSDSSEIPKSYLKRQLSF